MNHIQLEELLESNKPKLIFVYGSLKAGHYNHDHFLRNNLPLQQRVKTKPEYSLYDLGAYPGLAHHGTTAVVGEIYQVDANTFYRMHGMEAGARYKCEPVNLEIQHEGETIYCWTRNELKNPAVLITSGEWLLPEDRQSHRVRPARMNQYVPVS